MSSSLYRVQEIKNCALTFENENIKKINHEKTQECVHMRAELDKKNKECFDIRAQLDEKNKQCTYTSIELHKTQEEVNFYITHLKKLSIDDFRCETNKEFEKNRIKYNNLLHHYNTLFHKYENLSKKYTNRMFDINHDELHY